MNTELKRSLLYSTLLHGVILVVLFNLFNAFMVARTPLLMELTLIGQMSQGYGLGANASQAGDTTGVTPRSDTGQGDFDTPARKAEEPTAAKDIAGEVSLKTTPKVQEEAASDAEKTSSLEALREAAPIGIDPHKDVTKRIKTTTGLGHAGIAGSPDGNANIEGQLAARGVKKKVFPEYPDWAKKQGIEGSVKYRITVLPNGLLKDDIQVDQTSGYREMDKIVYDALLQWEFEPLPPVVAQVDQGGVITFIFNFRGVTAQ